MDYTGVFTYNLANIQYTPENMITALILAVIFAVIVIVLRYVALFAVGAYWLRDDEKKIIERKKILGDLILMKDIQTELEKEIEQATLQAAFQN